MATLPPPAKSPRATVEKVVAEWAAEVLDIAKAPRFDLIHPLVWVRSRLADLTDRLMKAL